ncbi:MAG: hypothetical protein QM654_01570 [Dysgonamonadaceae bacterium]
MMNLEKKGGKKIESFEAREKRPYTAPKITITKLHLESVFTTGSATVRNNPAIYEDWGTEQTKSNDLTF